ncbi:MAG: DNA-binding domain-containing protein [Myxococcota bacterium]|nr:DNA-binding domain-containing protein [Myxococcota bacterium]
MLRDLQEEFAGALYEDDPESGRVVAARGMLSPLAQLTPAQGLALYRSSVANTLEETLGEIFPVCAQLVGEDCFRTVARLYLRAQPSRHPDLARAGDAWPAFVAAQDFLSGVPYLADVARLELGLHRAHTAPWPARQADAESMGEAIAASPENWRLLLTPSATLVASPHPVLTIWEAHQDGRIDRGWTLDPGAAGEQVIVCRSGGEICADSVEASLWPLLLSISAGEAVSAQLRLAEGLRAAQGPDTQSSFNSGDGLPIFTTIRALFDRGWVVGACPT